MDDSIVVLVLEHGKYYLSKINDSSGNIYSDEFVLNYFKTNSVEWLNLHPIIKVGTIKYGNIDYYTVLAMDRFNPENVRGGVFNNISDEVTYQQFKTFKLSDEFKKLNGNFSDSDSDGSSPPLECEEEFSDDDDDSDDKSYNTYDSLVSDLLSESESESDSNSTTSVKSDI